MNTITIKNLNKNIESDISQLADEAYMMEAGEIKKIYLE